MDYEYRFKNQSEVSKAMVALEENTRIRWVAGQSPTGYTSGHRVITIDSDGRMSSGSFFRNYEPEYSKSEFLNLLIAKFPKEK